MKVLICDDEENIRNLMKRFLALEGLDSDTAENGLYCFCYHRPVPFEVGMNRLLVQNQFSESLFQGVECDDCVRHRYSYIPQHGGVRQVPLES